MPDEINSGFSQALGRYRDALREYVSLYKKATPVDNAKLIQRDREMTRLQRKLAEAAEPLGIDWKADVQKELGAG
jgi:hypothetical protein